METLWSSRINKKGVYNLLRSRCFLNLSAKTSSLCERPLNFLGLDLSQFLSRFDWSGI